MTDLPKLLVSRALPDSVMDALRDHFDVTCRDTTQPMDLPECRAALADYDVILPTLGDAFGDDAFTGTIRAKGLANFGVGYNHIDVEAARKAGLVVTNTPGAVTDATADIALTLILMTARRAGEGERMVRAGNWQGWHPTQMLGMHISGKTLGVIGMGRIGQAIARRCHHGFGMDVVFHNRSVKSVPGARQLASVVEVCQTADIVVTLQAGGIAGAGLDVYEQEPHVPAALMALENVVLLPHLGTAALEVREDMGRMAMDNAVAIAEGRDPPNPV